MSGAVEGVALLPCPFCGGTDGDLVETFTRATDTLMIWSVECERCGAERASDASEYEAREFWNTRTTPPARSYADGVEDAAKVADYLATTAASLQVAMGLHGVDAPIKNAQRETATTLAAAIRLLSHGGKAERYRHVKRGTVYEVIGRAELQVNNIALTDGVTMVVYRGEDGKLWVRGEAEFRDGRFEPVAPSDPASDGGAA